MHMVLSFEMHALNHLSLKTCCDMFGINCGRCVLMCLVAFVKCDQLERQMVGEVDVGLHRNKRYVSWKF